MVAFLFRGAGAAGFEPADVGSKGRCLTTWRRPNARRYNNSDLARNIRTIKENKNRWSITSLPESLALPGYPILTYLL